MLLIHWVVLSCNSLLSAWGNGGYGLYYQYTILVFGFTWSNIWVFSSALSAYTFPVETTHPSLKLLHCVLLSMLYSYDYNPSASMNAKKYSMPNICLFPGSILPGILHSGFELSTSSTKFLFDVPGVFKPFSAASNLSAVFRRLRFPLVIHVTR